MVHWHPFHRRWSLNCGRRRHLAMGVRAPGRGYRRCRNVPSGRLASGAALMPRVLTCAGFGPSPGDAWPERSCARAPHAEPLPERAGRRCPADMVVVRDFCFDRFEMSTGRPPDGCGFIPVLSAAGKAGRERVPVGVVERRNVGTPLRESFRCPSCRSLHALGAGQRVPCRGPMSCPRPTVVIRSRGRHANARESAVYSAMGSSACQASRSEFPYGEHSSRVFATCTASCTPPAAAWLPGMGTASRVEPRDRGGRTPL